MAKIFFNTEQKIKVFSFKTGLWFKVYKWKIVVYVSTNTNKIAVFIYLINFFKERLNTLIFILIKKLA